MDVDDSYSLMRFLFRYINSNSISFLLLIRASWFWIYVYNQDQKRELSSWRRFWSSASWLFFMASILTNFKSAGKMTKFHLFSLFIFLRRCERGERLMLASHSTNHTFLYRFFNDLKVYMRTRGKYYIKRDHHSRNK